MNEKVPWSHGNTTVLHILENIVFLRAELPTNWTKSVWDFDIHEQIINLDVLVKILVA